MESKNYKILLLSLFTILTLGTYAQQNQQVYSVFDSNVIKSTRMAQQNEFWRNTYDFPAKPRDLFEFGISGGLFNVAGNVDSRLLAPGMSVHLRKALGYFLSLRAQYTYGVAQGLNFFGSHGYSNNPAWIGNGYNPATDQVFFNYRSKVHDLSLEALASLNNILFHRQKSNTSIFVGAGVGFTAYHTMVNALGPDGKPYTALFNSIPQAEQTHKNRRELIRKLRAGMDNTYETEAENDGSSRARLNGYTVRPSFSALFGINFRLSRTVNLALEEKYTIIHDHLLDGQRWSTEGASYLGTTVSATNDSYAYTSAGLNFNIGNKATHTEPLWWINPLDYAYSELNNPRHMKLPKPILDDTDGDGVIDQLDQCPNTPAGVAVNAHGCPLDTDGDGVPDYKDKELITPTYCQPVDADGVGKCPEPECCKNMVTNANTSTCTIGDLPSISFRNKRGLSADAKSMLATIASKMKSSATCAITVTGYPAASKASQAECNRRINDIKNYLIEKEGISADRITTNCEIGGGDANTVDIKGVAK